MNVGPGPERGARDERAQVGAGGAPPSDRPVGPGRQAWAHRLTLPLSIYLVCAGLYVATLGGRWDQRTPDAHFVHLADSFVHGQLSVVGDRPPGSNDWARYGDRWYVSFPPFPAVLLVPLVAAFGTDIPDRLVWALIAGLGPALLFVLLRNLSEARRSARNLRDNLALVALFAFGSVYYFVSVQGSVWFAAHVVSVVLLTLHLWFAVGARRPAWAGLTLGLSFMTRATTLFAFPFFVVEALAASRMAGSPAGMAGEPWPSRLRAWLGGVDWRAAVGRLARFAVPLVAIGCLAMVLNLARFDDPFEFGHSYLQIRWRPRIEKWGLFNYHYLARNLAVLVAALPWLSDAAPYVRISRHGVALWLTTPQLGLALWPKHVHARLVGLYLAAGAVALLDLLYQNSGWVQFGYRFALDYMPLLFVALAIGGQRFGAGFYLLMICAFAINAFGAITFDRMPQFYDTDPTQRVIFQPD